MLNNGRLQFGINGAVRSLAETTTAYNNGQWHHVVATQGADGMKLYVDGVRSAANPATDAQNYTGYWRLGGDRTLRRHHEQLLRRHDRRGRRSTRPRSRRARVRAHYDAAGRRRPTSRRPRRSPRRRRSSTVAVDGTTLDRRRRHDRVLRVELRRRHAPAPAPPRATRYAAAGTYTVTLTVTDDERRHDGDDRAR